MKTIGLLGGMSWESTAVYYRLLNQRIRDELGGLNSARILLNSLNFAPIEQYQREGRWAEAAEQLRQAAQALQQAGADCLLIGTNTMHKVADEVQAGLDIPLLHIAEATAEALNQRGVSRAGLLGTRFTMEERFYRDKLEQAGLAVEIPDREARSVVDRVIFEELCQGQIHEHSRARFVAIANDLAERGAEALVLGCTEIGLLLRAHDVPLPLVDTTVVHVDAAIDFALGRR